jgi:hypothetical protein
MTAADVAVVLAAAVKAAVWVVPAVVAGFLVERAWRARHEHTWTYERRSMGGWGVVHCDECGEVDIY